MIYLDNSATTRPFDSVIDTMDRCMRENYFNASAAYKPAVDVDRAMRECRRAIAAQLGIQESGVIFTGGGTESDNLAILGVAETLRQSANFVCSAIEHPAVAETIHRVEQMGHTVRVLPIDVRGVVDLAACETVIDEHTALVSCMQVSNETGAIQPVEELAKLARRKNPNVRVHVDGVQGFLKVPLEARNCDFYTVSGHKFHGPKGVGALYVKKGTRFLGGQIGGGQEKNLRSGTTNTPGIMGMDAALQYYLANQETMWENMRACKLHLAENLLALPDVFINGPAPEEGAPHILNVSFLGVRGEVLLHALEEKKIYVSTGSACSAQGKNRILNAMGVTGERQEGAIRFSFSAFNTPGEMDETAAAIADLLGLLRRFKRR